MAVETQSSPVIQKYVNAPGTVVVVFSKICSVEFIRVLAIPEEIVRRAVAIGISRSKKNILLKKHLFATVP